MPMPAGRSAPSFRVRIQSTLPRPATSGSSSVSRIWKRKTVPRRRGDGVLMNIPPSEMFAEYSLMKLEKCSNCSTTSRSNGTLWASSGGSGDRTSLIRHTTATERPPESTH